MKKSLKAIISLMLALLLCVSYFGVSAFAAESEGGYIVLPENADIKLTTAADTLAKYLNQITDKAYPVSNSGEGIKFVIDYTKDIADNGYIINTSETEVTIKGSGVRGVIHGVYAFLEKYCNCDWYTKDFTSVPKNENLKFTKDVTTYEPYFEYTDTDWYSRINYEYSLANGLTGGREIPEEYGGAVNYLGSGGHSLTNYFCKEDDYFESNPELFALHGGVRTPNQLCLTNEETYKIVRDEVFALLQEKHNPDEYLQIVSLTQDDNGDMCECESCKAIDDANNSCAGTMITFVNRIAKDVKAAGYTNVAIDTFAYQYTRACPTKVVPEDNVIVRFCTIGLCFAHAIDDDTCSDNASYANDLAEWGKICDRIYVWDYATNYANTLGIFPNFGVMQKNTQYFYENNVKGIYEEGNYYISNCDAEFGDLRCYLLAKLMQNPYMDYDAALTEFANAFYGEAGPFIKKFIDMTIKKPVEKNRNLTIYCYMEHTLSFNSFDILTADRLWKQAKNAVAENETYTERVLRSELCWRYWRLFNTSDFMKTDEFVEDAKSMGIVKYSEGGDSTENADNYIGKLQAKVMEHIDWKALLNPVALVAYIVYKLQSL